MLKTCTSCGAHRRPLDACPACGHRPSRRTLPSLAYVALGLVACSGGAKEQAKAPVAAIYGAPATMEPIPVIDETEPKKDEPKKDETEPKKDETKPPVDETKPVVDDSKAETPKVEQPKPAPKKPVKMMPMPEPEYGVPGY